MPERPIQVQDAIQRFGPIRDMRFCGKADATSEQDAQEACDASKPPWVPIHTPCYWIWIIPDKKPEAVDHPTHYNLGGVEVIDAIDAWDLTFCLGNVVKYVARAGRKDPSKTLEDLKKARWYLDHEIEKRGAEPAKKPDSPILCRRWDCTRVKGHTGDCDPTAHLREKA